MVKAELGTQLVIAVDNRVGALAEAARIVAGAKINLLAVCAYVIESKGFILFVTEDNQKAKEALKKKHYEVKEEEVVCVSVDNKPGTLEVVAEKIAKAGIDIRLIYGTADKSSKTNSLIILAENNKAALATIQAK